MLTKQIRKHECIRTPASYVLPCLRTRLQSFGMFCSSIRIIQHYNSHISTNTIVNEQKKLDSRLTQAISPIKKPPFILFE